MKTNVEEIFLQLIDKRFPRFEMLYKSSNKDIMKGNYSYTNNMQKIIDKLNAKYWMSILTICDVTVENTKIAPWMGTASQEIKHKAVVSDWGNYNEMYIYIYIRLSKIEWKKRFCNCRKPTEIENTVNYAGKSSFVFSDK